MAGKLVYTESKNSDQPAVSLGLKFLQKHPGAKWLALPTWDHMVLGSNPVEVGIQPHCTEPSIVSLPFILI